MTEDEVIEIVFKKKYPTSRQAAIDEVEIWKLCGLFKPGQESVPTMDDIPSCGQENDYQRAAAQTSALREGNNE